MIERLAEVSGRPVSRETYGLIQRYAELLREGSEHQNLVAASTLPRLWERHIIDSAQLARFAPRPGSSWVDIGSGAGLPGLVIALLTDGPVQLVEPRRLRAEFLRDCVDELGLQARVAVSQSNAQQITGRFDVITARAVAALPSFLRLAHHLAHPGTVWALPKGQGADAELAEAQRSWHCRARSEPSMTDPDARILVLSQVGAKRRT
jgi:16S rRNA (guanine527-N7)-methyltransferase